MPVELLTPEGLRVDGRRSKEIRKLTAKIGVIGQSSADGAAYLEQGNTKCLALVYCGPSQTPHHLQQESRLVIQFAPLPFSSVERRHIPQHSSYVYHTQHLLTNLFSPLISIPSRSTITISIQLLQRDGSELAALINCVGLALIDAGVGMKDFVVACGASVTSIGGGTTNANGFTSLTDAFNDASMAETVADNVLVDPNYIEESQNIPTITVAVLPRSGKLPLLHYDTSRLPASQLPSLIKTALGGCLTIKSMLEDVVRDVTSKRAARVS